MYYYLIYKYKHYYRHECTRAEYVNKLPKGKHSCKGKLTVLMYLQMYLLHVHIFMKDLYMYYVKKDEQL